MSVVNDLRPRFNMEDKKDVEAWELLNEISRTPPDTLITAFVKDLQDDVDKLTEEIEQYEKLRLRNLRNKVLRGVYRSILNALRKDRDELRETLRGKTYKRVVETMGRRDSHER